MIYTVTFNPSIDYIVYVDDFEVGQVNRMKNDYKYPGGKGINISRVLSKFGVKSKALGFIGGFTGEYLKNSLQQEGIDVDFIPVEGDTRINVKLKCNEETEINGGGPNITKADLNKLLKNIEKLTFEDILVLAGNVQKCLPRNTYSQIQKKTLTNKVKVVVDTTGETLVNTLQYRPFLIKPNIDELRDIFKTEINSEDQIVQYGKKLIEMGAENIVISMAGDGAILLNKKGVYRATAPKGTVKNSVGAGDSLIGGFLANYAINSDVIEAFKWGVASGSATAFSMDLCEKEEVESLIRDVTVTKLNDK